MPQIMHAVLDHALGHVVAYVRTRLWHALSALFGMNRSEAPHELGRELRDDVDTGTDSGSSSRPTLSPPPPSWREPEAGDADEWRTDAYHGLCERAYAAGRALGRNEGQRELLLKLLSLRFGRLSPAERLHVRNISWDERQRAAERIFTASTLASVLQISTASTDPSKDLQRTTTAQQRAASLL
jgi:hypothetical protein